MKQIKTSAYLLVATSMLFIFSCTDATTTSEANDMDTAAVASNTDTSAMPLRMILQRIP